MAEKTSEQTENQIQFALHRIYIKDSSFEIPKAPEIFRIKWDPNVALELETSYKAIESHLYEVSIVVTAKVTTTGELAFIVEVEQAGIFTVGGLEGEALEHTLGAYCPNILFPYAREALDNMVIRGSFPALMLAPVNFDALYESKKQQQAANDESEENPTIN